MPGEVQHSFLVVRRFDVTDQAVSQLGATRMPPDGERLCPGQLGTSRIASDPVVRPDPGIRSVNVLPLMVARSWFVK